VQSLLIALLVIAIILVLAIVFIPAYLERLARRNRARRAEYAADAQQLRRESGRRERALAPFAQTHAAVYRQGVEAGEKRLRLLSSRLDNVEDLLDELGCPGISTHYLLPVQHFLLAPGDVGLILADARRLRLARAALDAAAVDVTATQAALDALAALPGQLAAERAALASRLADVEAAVAREREAGIEALDDLTRQAGEMRALLADWDRASAPDAGLAALDGGAAALESAAAGLAELEARVAATANDRAVLDQRLRRAVAELDNAQTRIKTGPGAADAPAQVRPLLRRAAALLNESAPAHRRRREFAAAGGDVDAAARLIALSRDLTAAERQTRLLEERDDGAGQSEAIAGLRRELSELFDGVAREGDAPAEALAGRAAQARARADALTRQQDEAIAELEREALAARDRLERAWERSQRLLQLADDDPLARRRARLLDDFAAAQRRPAALEAFRRDVAAFEAVVAPWVTRVQATRQLIDRLRPRLPELIDRARATAAPWNCLAGHVTIIQQRAADFETAQAQFAAVRHKRAAESLMDELEQIEGDVDERFDQLIDWANQLGFSQDEVGEILNLVAGQGEWPPDHPFGRKHERALKLIDHHTAQAHAAARYEDASLALRRAVDVANKLALSDL
jgi:hypothetical protein